MKPQQKLFHAASVMVWVFAILVFYVLGGGSAQGLQEATAVQGLNTSIPEADAQELSATRLEAVMRQNLSDSDEAHTLHKQRSSSFDWYVEEQTQTDQQIPQIASEPAEPPVTQFKPAATKSRVGTARRRYEQERADAYKQRQEQLQQIRNMFLHSQGDQQQTTQQAAAAPPKPKATVVQSGRQTGFYGLSEATTPTTDIRAVIHGEHRNLQRGSIVKLRLLDNIQIENNIIPANTFLYGQLSFSSRRAMIRIDNIQYNQTVYPFSGTIYDNDGFEGLYVPDNKIDQAGRKAGGQILGQNKISLSGPAFIASTANAALGAIQSVAQQVVVEDKINISSNYQVTIKQEP